LEIDAATSQQCTELQTSKLSRLQATTRDYLDELQPLIVEFSGSKSASDGLDRWSLSRMSSTRQNVRKIRHSQSEHAVRNNTIYRMLKICQHLFADTTLTKRLVNIQKVSTAHLFPRHKALRPSPVTQGHESETRERYRTRANSAK